MLETSVPVGLDPAGGAEPLDLAVLTRAIGAHGAQPARSSTPRQLIEVIDPHPSPVDLGLRPDVAAYVDGCQAARVLTYRGHRPVTLWWASAAALQSARPDGLWASREAVGLCCSYADERWARSLPGAVPVEVVDAVQPWDVAAATANLIDERRREFEVTVADEVDAGHGLVVIDGDLRGKSFRDDFVSCAKTVDGIYLADERSVFELEPGWRSPIFRIVPSRRSDGDRYSAYVRLFDASRQWWGFGLVRIETHQVHLIDDVASLCMRGRQHLGADRRENHLAGVAAVELYLKARRPHLFSIPLP